MDDPQIPRNHHRLGRAHIDENDPGWGPELIYRFAPSAWGQNFGSELAHAATAYADELRLPELTAFAHPENIASVRILEKTGFAKIRCVSGMHRILFRRRLA